MNPISSPAEELKFLCRKLFRQSTNFDVLEIVNALQARLVDEMSAGWGRPKPQRGEDLNDLLEPARKPQSVSSPDVRIVATELIERLEVELAADANSDANSDANAHLSKAERRRAYQRELMRKRRAAAKAD